MKTLIKICIIILFALFTVNCPLLTANAAVPHLINYQGRLTDSGGTPLNGSYNLTFRIYDAETAGNLLWEEPHTSIVIQKGIFNVMLGSVTNLDLPFDKQYFLEIKVGNEVMSPRQRIASAGYAIRAENADSLPRGIITMWSGTIVTIPSGWALCDGTNGTPDLRDRFIVGARQDDEGVAKTNVTSSLTQSGNGSIPAHTHAAGTLTADSNGAHTHGSGLLRFGTATKITPSHTDAMRVDSGDTASAGAHTHTLSGSSASYGTGSTNIAVYYALAFIMKL